MAKGDMNLIKNTIKSIIFTVPQLETLFIKIQAGRLHRKYVSRREHYNSLCNERGLVYCEEDVRNAVQARLCSRGFQASSGVLGEIKTVSFIPIISWHKHLLNELQLLGPVYNFDYEQQGLTSKQLRANVQGTSNRMAVNDRFRSFFTEIIRQTSVDWVFVYANAYEFPPDNIRWIQENYGCPVVVMSLDCKQSWDGLQLSEGFRSLAVDQVSVVDLFWTSARVTCDWILAEGGCPIYLPEGCDATVYVPSDVEKDIPVSFIGGKYGFRARVISHLRNNGIPVKVFGSGWGTRSVWGEEAVDIMRHSQINLGMGGIGYSEFLKNVKTRDFEVTCVGGGVYLTSFNPDLAMHFNIGQEIACYSNDIELVELIRYYLEHKEEADLMAKRARDRCLREHRWVHRYIAILQVLGIMREDMSPTKIWVQHSENIKHQ